MITRDSAAFLRRSGTATEYLFKAVFVADKKAEADLYARFIRPGTVAIDVGAHVGYFSRRFARANPGGVVLAFEPQSLPRAIMTVASFFKRNQNVLLMPLALGEGMDLLELKIPIKRGGGIGIGLAHVGEADDLSDRFEVRREIAPAARLDDVLAKLDVGAVSFIKVDVEGGELSVLRGAVETLRSHRPAIVCEIDGREGRFGHGAGDLAAFLSDLGYTPCDPATGDALPRGETLKNTLFLPA